MIIYSISKLGGNFMAKKPHGYNMIKVVTKFWTSNLPSNVDDKTAHASGVIYLPANKFRGIKADMERFWSLDEYLKMFQKLIDRNNIKLVKLTGVEKKKFV